jgi:hypothetical protein
MAKLSYEQRKHLPSSAFAEPKTRKYPIEDKAHARAALARVSRFGTSKEKQLVRRKVKQRFPTIRVSA